MSSSFYEFYKKMNQEKRIREANAPAPAAPAPQGGQPQQPAAGGQQQPAQAVGQGTAQPANDKALEEIKKMWPQIQKLIPQIQDQNLKKSFEELAKNPALTQQGQQAAAAKPQAPTPQQGQQPAPGQPAQPAPTGQQQPQQPQQ